MAATCEICGKAPQYGNRISHAHNISRRRWLPNLRRVHAIVNGVHKRLRVCTACIRSGKVVKVASAKPLPRRALAVAAPQS